MTKLITLLAILGVSSLNAAPIRTPKISATAKITNPNSGGEVTKLAIGGQYAYNLVTLNANLAANRAIAVNYTITVTPDNSAPVTLSGRIVLKATLPASDGGAAETTAQAASVAGTQSYSGLITIPDSLPEGVATIALTVNTGTTGTVNVKKRYVLELLDN